MGGSAGGGAAAQHHRASRPQPPPRRSMIRRVFFRFSALAAHPRGCRRQLCWLRPSLPCVLGRTRGPFASVLAKPVVASVRLRMKFGVIIMAFIAICGLVPAGDAQAAPDNRSKAQAELDTVVDELNALETWLSDAERRRVRWLKDVRSKDLAVAKVNSEVQAGEDALLKAEETIAALRVQRERLDRQRAAALRLLAAHIGAAYRISGKAFLELLFSQDSVQSAERMLVYQRFVILAREQAVAAYRQLAERAERNADALARQQAGVQQELAQLRSRREQLQKEREARQTLLAGLNQQVEDKENRQHRLQADRQRLRKLIAQIELRATPGGGNFATRKGQLPWPMRGPLVSRFGEPRANSGMNWEGVQVKGALGAPVVAVHGGRVVFADWLRGFGLVAIVDHGAGYMTLYGHADQLVHKADDFVEAGEVIAHAGQSGGATAAGIYFELRAKGRPLDPMTWLSE